MPRIRTIILLVSVTFFFHHAYTQIPKAKAISDYQQTDFVPTLEHQFSMTRNAIYCSSFLYAWNEFRNTLKSPLEIDSALHDLFLVNKSTSFMNTLSRGEYTSRAEVKGETIKFYSEFSKALPFEYPLKGGGHLNFGGKEVASFGNHPDGYDRIYIRYYKDDGEFIIQLDPKDSEHEIILYLPRTTYGSMAEIVGDIAKKCKAWRQERSETTDWKYRINERDTIQIPELAFNISANFPGIENSRFSSNSNNFLIVTAKQRIGFRLDEYGGEVVTEGVGEVIFSVPYGEIPRAKKMVLDKPFFLMVRRVNSSNPYFAVWVANTELMVCD